MSGRARRGYPVTAWSTVNSLGTSTEQVVSALRRGRASLVPPPLGAPIETVCGVVDTDLPALPKGLERFDSRNNRFVQQALAEIGSALDAARERWGAERVGICVGFQHLPPWTKSRTPTTSTPRPARFRRASTSFLSGSFDGLIQTLRALTGLEGPAAAISNACASSGKAFASARRWLDAGVVDAVLVGGAEQSLPDHAPRFPLAGSPVCEPTRPFSSQRRGINIGEGAAFALLERSGEGPRLLGAGESGDAHHMTTPDPEGRGAQRSMEAAISDAGVSATDIDYVNAHGTGTAFNDAMEARAIRATLGAQADPVRRVHEGLRRSYPRRSGRHRSGLRARVVAEWLDPGERGRRSAGPGNRTEDSHDGRRCRRPRGAQQFFCVRRKQCESRIRSARMKPVYVRGLGFWTPGYASPEAWCRGEFDPSVDAPEVALLSGPLRRRATGLTRVAVEVLHQATRTAGCDVTTVPIVWATAHGEHTTAIKILGMMRSGEGKLSPTHFPQFGSQCGQRLRVHRDWATAHRRRPLTGRRGAGGLELSGGDLSSRSRGGRRRGGARRRTAAAALRPQRRRGTAGAGVLPFVPFGGCRRGAHRFPARRRSPGEALRSIRATLCGRAGCRCWSGSCSVDRVPWRSKWSASAPAPSTAWISSSSGRSSSVFA